jgi:hypothetical protein
MRLTTCPLCTCPIQRTLHGTIADGMTAHYHTVHPESEAPADEGNDT